ncbi:putative Eukaryotic translation initiation factor 4E [Hypsibius exemplaris]|uniref:Eukaryotic translation initiation factor 4E n=1 Tax=Hypsibius exemplaris TaxID=2072580 RepID=A0A1W0WJ52_HYPEX|nr:putative Eukaryotic translation initiation factor 4E [Hypsibius exemplaris]
MDKSMSYHSCSTGDSYGPPDNINRMADFDMDPRLSHSHHSHHYHHNHPQQQNSFAKYRDGDGAGAETARFNPDGAWPNFYVQHRETGRLYGNGGRRNPADDQPYDSKYRTLIPQRRPGDQFDHQANAKNSKTKPEPAAGPTQRGVRLRSAWTYWHVAAEGGTEEDWKAGMKPMCTFDFKEQFWGMWNSIKPPSELGAKRELALFRGGLGRRPVWPDWNDTENVDGGRWKIIVRVTELPQIVDNFWRDLMVHCIEERWVPYSGFVNGVSITVKGQFYRVYVWLCSSKPAYVEFIRDRTKELLKDIPYVQMDYVTGNGERPQQRGPLVEAWGEAHLTSDSKAEKNAVESPQKLVATTLPPIERRFCPTGVGRCSRAGRFDGMAGCHNKLELAFNKRFGSEHIYQNKEN